VIKSKAGNTSYLPDSGWTLINVEAIPEYVDNFENNFEATNTDVHLQGFTLETPLVSITGHSTLSTHTWSR
jgi:hypothetical protein